jgi:imidazolonepropionase-like amidohydrolase
MRRFTMLAPLVALGAMASVVVYSQTPSAGSSAVIYEGARLIIGDAATPPIDDGAFVVQDGLIAAIGRRGAVTAPAGAARVDLSGKTVMPALIDVHAHFGYEKYTKAGGDSRAEHYTPENLLDHFQRQAFYGVGTVHDGGTASVPISLQFQADQRARKYPPAAQYSFNPGVVPPEGGPDDILIKGTRPLRANYEVIRAREARAAVQDIAAKEIHHLKIWIGDRNGSYPAMPHEVYDAIIEEAHKHGIKVHAHAMSLRDQKDIIRAGADLIVHIVANTKLDDELLALVKEKKPYWVPSIGMGIPALRREVCENEPFTTQVLSADLLADILATECSRGGPNAEREQMLRNNFNAMRAAGARVVLGTDAGIRPSKTFGSADHHELTTYVRLGMSTAEAIETGTARAAELLGLKDVGTLARGKHADFLVLDANPLDDILNTRKISAVYLRGARLDREALLAKWTRTNTSQ